MTFDPILSTTPPASGHSKQIWSPELFDSATGDYPVSPLPGTATYPETLDEFQFYEGSVESGDLGFFIASNADQIAYDKYLTFDPASSSRSNSVSTQRVDRVAREAVKWGTSLISMQARQRSRVTIYSGPPGVNVDEEETTPIPVLPSSTVRIGSSQYTVSSMIWTEPESVDAVTVLHWPGGPPPPSSYLISDTQIYQVVALQLTPIGGAPADLATILSPGDMVHFV